MHTTFPLTPEQLRENRLEWIQALESNKYEQGIEVLCQVTDNHKTYCCLGVLQDLVPNTVWIQRGNLVGPYEDKRFHIGLPTDKARHVVDIDRMTTTLAIMNDEEKKSFKDIAKYLRELWDIHE